MFGMLSGSRSNRPWRQVYAGLCRHQHRHFGIRSTLFLSYEAMFLYLLGVDAGVLPTPPDAAPSCCKLRKRFAEGAWLDERAATFCAAFGLILARIKLDDDVRDDGSLAARTALALYRKPFAAAEAWFDSEAPALRAQLTVLMDQHLAMEREQAEIAMPSYVQPTAEAFGKVYATFARMIGADEAAFFDVGADVGAYIIAYDCAIDWCRDRQRGRYNPLPDRIAVQEACAYTQQRLTRALWRCDRALHGEGGIGVLQHVFGRVSRQLDHFRESIEPLPAGKAGFCLCCECCDAGCPSPGTSCDFNCCFEACDVKDQKKEPAKPSRAPADSMAGKRGITCSPLTPTGVVNIGGREYAAIAQTENLPPNMEVEVVAQTAAGIVVKRAPTPAPPSA